jgi:hypothetical protein
VKKLLAGSVLAFGIWAFSEGAARSAQEAPFLTVYYNNGQAVLCSEYNTANGARLSTYQWWLLGFVSGAGHARHDMKLPMARIDAGEAIEWAGNYCAAKPSEKLGSAAAALVVKLGSARAK